MNEMKSITLNGTKYDSFPDQSARERLDILEQSGGSDSTQNSAGIYDLDLTAAVSVDFTQTDIVRYVITDDVDAAEIMAAVTSGKHLRLRFVSTGGIEHTVLMGNYRIRESDVVCGCVAADLDADWDDPGIASFILRLDGNAVILDYSPGLGTASVATDQVTSISVVRADNQITVTTPMESGVTYVDTITLDDNGCPTNINNNGADIPVTFVGFAASTTLPVVELTTTVVRNAVFTTNETAALTAAYDNRTPMVIRCNIQTDNILFANSAILAMTTEVDGIRGIAWDAGGISVQFAYYNGNWVVSSAG